MGRLTHLVDPAAWTFHEGDLLGRRTQTLTCCEKPTRHRGWISWWSDDGPQPTCKPCRAKYPYEVWRAANAIEVLCKWLSWMNTLGRYCRCRVCNGKVNDQQFRWALRQYQQQLCSPECLQTETKQRYACCMEAVPSPCVCMYSFDCKTHGETHVGTHE